MQNYEFLTSTYIKKEQKQFLGINHADGQKAMLNFVISLPQMKNLSDIMKSRRAYFGSATVHLCEKKR